MGAPQRPETGLRVTLDIWHPDCRTLAVTEGTDAGLLGHGVYTIDGAATGRFTVYGETADEIEALVAAARASPLTDSVWEADAPHVADGRHAIDEPVPGTADLDLDSDVDIGFREAPAPDVRYGPYVTDPDAPLVNALSAGVRTVTRDDPAIGYFSSVGDFNYFGHRADLPTVIVGPDGENIHGAGEFVYTDDVVDVARIVAAGCVSLLA